ncbi:MAG: fibronectin type III domain-containing protein [Patescibacteria group bacterium]|nr:fibronectin type III domain-containing protein [Patescibacteria group bacterium]MDD4304338.1 fibronectin type III domain-containing protein [Patescibacteria group bacterium]MDD4695601.1 fibronectin type III domain-containing protein [Patescibacteria group bacterium]
MKKLLVFSLLLLLLITISTKSISASDLISNVQIQTSQNSTTITWNSNELDKSYILWGMKNTDNDINIVSQDPTYTTVHSITINNLAPNTTYYYKILSRTNSSNIMESAVYTFTTLEDTTSSDLIYNIQINTTENSAKIIWDSNNLYKSYILWGMKNTDNDINIVSQDPTYTKNHELTINNLIHNSKYYFKIQYGIINNGATESQIYEFTTLDKELSSDLIYNIQINTTKDSAKITWNSYEDDQSYLLYGTKNTNNDIGTVSKDDNFLKNHELLLNHLNPNTTYYFRIYSKRSTNSIVESETFSFTTKKIINPDKELSNKLKGKLLLGVEDKGRIWYVNPSNQQKYEVTFTNALLIFQKLSLGITNKDLNQISNTKSTTLGNKLKGKLLLQVEDKGRIWYIDSNGIKHEVTWVNLMDLFTSLSLGITNDNLDKIEDGNI